MCIRDRLISDVVGYTKLMESDTEGTVSAWSDARDNVIKPLVASKDGRIVKFTGDGFLVEFGTVQAALECGIDMQNKLTENSLDFRMAINLGDIIDDGEDIHGEGINIAARLEGIAEPGGICISGDVYNQVRNRIVAEYEDLGPQEVKNVAEPVQVYAVQFKKLASVSDEGTSSSLHEKPSIAVLPFNNMSGDPEQETPEPGLKMRSSEILDCGADVFQQARLKMPAVAAFESDLIVVYQQVPGIQRGRGRTGRFFFRLRHG